VIHSIIDNFKHDVKLTMLNLLPGFSTSSCLCLDRYFQDSLYRLVPASLGASRILCIFLSPPHAVPSKILYLASEPKWIDTNKKLTSPPPSKVPWGIQVMLLSWWVALVSEMCLTIQQDVFDRFSSMGPTNYVANSS
jgi:hypothetical protein